jgi:hypothetical protein
MDIAISTRAVPVLAIVTAGPACQPDEGEYARREIERVPRGRLDGAASTPALADDHLSSSSRLSSRLRVFAVAFVFPRGQSPFPVKRLNESCDLFASANRYAECDVRFVRQITD